MKNLIKKLLIPIVISSQLLLPFSSFAKERLREEKSRYNFYFGGGIGIYRGTENMSNVYNNMLRFRGNIGLDLSKNFRLEGTFTYIDDKKGPNVYNVYGKDMSVKPKINIVGLDALIHYLIPIHVPTIYLGGGLTFMNTKEEVSFSLSSNNTSTFKASVNAIGPTFAFGVDIPINKEKTKNIYLEFSKRSAKFNWVFNEVLDMGGRSFDAGVRYKF